MPQPSRSRTRLAGACYEWLVLESTARFLQSSSVGMSLTRPADSWEGPSVCVLNRRVFQPPNRFCFLFKTGFPVVASPQRRQEPVKDDWDDDDDDEDDEDPQKVWEDA